MENMLKEMINVITTIIQKIIDFFIDKKKWKLKIYFLNQLVATKRINKFNDISDIFKKPYICKVHKKHIFNTFHTQVVLIPDKALFLDEDKREIHINCVVYEGVGVNEL